jgi:hypothetical protein
MATYRIGNGETKRVRAIGPTARADGEPLAVSEISHYAQFMSYDGGTPVEMAVNLVEDASTPEYDGEFDEIITIDDQQAGMYEYWYQTVDTDDRRSVDSERMPLLILPPLVAPLPPTGLMLI